MSETLNPEQEKAVQFVDGALLVIAGAGSGKTRVVTFRIINLIELGVPPSRILGLTFTNKAAGEMRERVQKMTDSSVLICTFHSLGARILRESIHMLGFKNDFAIYDQDDSERLIRTCLQELEITDKKLEAKAFKALISKAKNEMKSPDDVINLSSKPLEQVLPQVYSLYQKKLLHCNAIDFDDLLFLPVRLFEEHPGALEYYRNRWDFLLIDEFQDTNEAQYKIIKMLVQTHRNIFAVGDPDQSIYSWRGANINNILSFKQDYPEAEIINLEQNYRSTSTILEASNELIAHNMQRYEKNLWSDAGAGEKIRLFTGDNETNEAIFVTNRILTHHEQGIPYREMAVFYRTNNQSRVFEDRFIAGKIPYVIIGGISFYQRKEIKDILAFLRMAQSGSDLISFTRTINLPKRGIGDATVENLHYSAVKEHLSILGYCKAILEDPKKELTFRLSSRQREGLRNYVTIIEKLHIMSKEGSLTDLVKAAIEDTNYLEYLKEDPVSYEDRKGNLDALINKAAEWDEFAEKPTLSGFLEELSLKSNMDEEDDNKDKIYLMTAHNAKGLEFDVVFLTGMEQDLFPHFRSKDNLKELEEERRLCYVGMTRAKKILYLSHCNYRYMWGVVKPQDRSIFIDEIPKKYLERVRGVLSTPTYAFEMPKKEPGPEKKKLSEPIVTYKQGDTVFHEKFGIGVIKDTHESPLGLIYKIFFVKEKVERSIVATYGRLSKV